MKIGTLAQRTGTNVPTVRYYESIGLLPKATRQEGGHRLLEAKKVRARKMIRELRGLGYRVELIAPSSTV